MKITTATAVAYILMTGAATLAGSDFIREGQEYFAQKTVQREAWVASERDVEGWDWSLPPWVRAHPRSMLKLWPTKISAGFPGRVLAEAVHYSWRDLEPQEGVYAIEPLRALIRTRSESGRKPVELHIEASVWETRFYAGDNPPADALPVRVVPGTAPLWMTNYRDVRMAAEPPTLNFRVVNMDIYHPDYHRRYIRMVEELARSGIAQMPELAVCYVHFRSSSRGEEGGQPEVGTAAYAMYLERLRAWAKAFAGVEYKLCTTTGKGAGLKAALAMGMGSRHGFVEMYMLETRNAEIGQWAGDEGYLRVDESNPLIADNRVSGDENEEYDADAIRRFGPLCTWGHRYREASLRALQMRRSFYWAEAGPFLIDPPLLNYVGLELGRKRADESPDAWCYLRESYGKVWNKAARAEVPYKVKNFDRWLFQRDGVGCVAEPTQRVDFGAQGAHQAGHPQDMQFDYTARKTSVADGNNRITFAVADHFLKDGPHRVAIKVTYVDLDNAKWALHCRGASGAQVRAVNCGHSGATRTATFILDDAMFPGADIDADFEIRATSGDAVIRFVRLIRLDEPPGFPNVSAALGEAAQVAPSQSRAGE